jgi:hypothetical protein
MPEPVPDPPPRPLTFAGGRYETERVLSEQPQRRVYLAVDTRLGRRVAITTFDTRGYDAVSLARARRRVQSAARIGEHPNIVGMFDLEETDGSVAIVSQYLPRGTVAELLARTTGGVLRRGDALRIAGQVATALEHAHEQGVAHGALTARRVWVADDGSVKVGGFGAPGGAPEPADDIRALGALLGELAGDGDPAVAELVQRLRDEDPPDAAAARAALAELAAAKARDETANGEQAAGTAARPAPEGAPETGPLDLLESAFVGRARETAALRDAWTAARSGSGHLVLVFGEPGIGKTRLLQDLDAHVQLEGALVAWGRCYEGEGAPAFWPWIQIIRSYARDRDAAVLAEQMGDGAADIAQIVSEVRERIPGLTVASPHEPQQARLRLFGAITALLKAAASEQPLLVILDDLHWADEPSLLMLRTLSRELAGTRLLVVATSRDDEAHGRPVLAQTLAALGRRAESRSVAMGGLDVAEVRGIVATLTKGRLRQDEERGLAEELTAIADGNPYFVHETLRHLLETGRLVLREDRWIWVPGSVGTLGVPDSVRDLITRRLERLSGDGNRALVAASVIGREFELDLLEAVSGLGHERLLDALAEASDARLAVAVRPGRRWTFAHALVRETLHDGLAGLRRARLHRRAGEALETLRAARAEHLAELAHHFREAGDTAKATDYSAQAGAHAAGMLAYEEAAEHYARALRAVDEAQVPDQGRRCELLLALGEAQSRAGLSDAARETFGSAAGLARAGGSADRLARAALGWGAGLGGFAYSSTSDSALIALIEEALEALGPEDSVVRVQLLSRLAIELYYKPAAERRDALTNDAVAMSRRLGDPRAQLLAQYGRHWALYGPDGLDERSAAGIELVRLAAEVGDREMAFRGHHCLLATMLELGWTEAADHNLGACEQIAIELRQPLYTWHCETFRALRLLMDGKLDEGEQAALAALRLGQRCHADMAAVFCGTQLILVRTFQGRLEEIEPIVSQMSERYPESSFGPALAFIHSETGAAEPARALFDTLAAAGFAEVRRDGNWLSSMALLCNVASFLRDAERAALLYDALAPYDGRIVIGCAGSVTQGPVATYLGITAATAGRIDQAVAHLSDGVAQAQDVGVPFAVWARRELGHALVARDGPGDRERGEQELRGALDEARRLGLVREVARIER